MAENDWVTIVEDCRHCSHIGIYELSQNECVVWFSIHDKGNAQTEVMFRGVRSFYLPKIVGGIEVGEWLIENVTSRQMEGISWKLHDEITGLVVEFHHVQIATREVFRALVDFDT